MKTKILLLTVFNLIFLKSFSQITVNITTPSHDPQVCGSTLFNVDVTFVGNQSVVQFGIEDLAGLTFSGNPSSITNSSVTYKAYPVTCNSTCTASFSITYACSFIPQTNSIGQVVSVMQRLKMFDGSNNPYQGTVSWSYDGNAITNSTLTYELGYYYLALQSGSAAPVLSNKGRTEHRYIIYKNNGNVDFTGSLEFHDDFACNKYALTQIKLYERIGTTDNLISPGPSMNVNGTDHTFTYDFSNVPIHADNQLVIEEIIDINDCLEECAPNSNISTFTIRWGCTGNLCRLTSVFTSTVARSQDRPLLTMYRTLPAPSGNLQNHGYWDQPNCNNGLIQWQYRIANDGNDVAYNVDIPLGNPDVSSSYLIDMTSVSLNQCTGCNLSILTTHSDIDLNTDHIICAENMTTPIGSINFHIDKLKPTEEVILNFTTKYCCPGLNDGSAPASQHVINLFDYDDIGFNTWRLYPVSDDECGLHTSFTSDDTHFSQGRYYTFYTVGQVEQWHLKQTFDPTTVDMTGVTCPSTGCNLADPVMFQIENTNLNNEWLNGDPLNRYKYGATPFCTGVENDPRQMLMSARIKLVFTMGAALRLYPLDNSNIFIKNGVTWNPSELPSSDACSAPGSERTYEVIFDGADLASLLPNSTLNLKDFLDFMNGSVITFHMIPCCCTSETNPDYTVKTYIEGICQDCWIPMSEIGSNIHVHCPGCITPGVQTTSAYLIRDESSLGYPDATNDGLKDSNQQIQLSNYSEASNLKLNRSIQGDVLTSTVTGNFYGGNGGCSSSSGGMDYATLQSRTCNATSPSPCTSNESGSYTFSHLYLDQTIPYSDPDRFNLQLLTCTFTVTRGTDVVTYELPSAKIDAVNTNHTAAQFLIDITPADIQTYGSGTFASSFAFTPGELYNAKLTYRVCSNYTIGTSEVLADNKFRSEILNAFYFSVIPLSQAPFSSHAQFGDHYINEQPTDQNYNCNGLCHTDIFQCATFTSMHYFYSIHAENYSSGFSNYPLSSGSGDACGKYINAVALTTIGGGNYPYYVSTNIFPYEFRPAPVMNKFHITIPTGYKVKPNTARLGNIFSTFGACYPYAFEVSRKNITVPSTGNFDVNLTTVDAGPNMGLNNSCSYDNYETGSIIKGDENTYWSLFMELEVVDCPGTPASVDIQPTDIQLEFASHNCSSSTPVTDHMSCTDCGELQKPSPILLVDDLSGVQCVSTTNFVRRIRITNSISNPNIPYGHASEHTFLYFVPSSNNYYSVTNVTCLTSCPSAPQLQSGFWQLGMILPGAVVDYEITFHINSCAGTSANISIPFYCGWNCYTYPADIDDDALCEKTLYNLQYQECPYSVTNTLVINEGQGGNTFQLCHDEKFVVTISTNDVGGLNDIRVDVTLPANLIFGNTAPSLVYSTNSGGNPETLQAPTPSGSAYSFALPLPPSANGYLSNGHRLVLTFYLRPKCSYNTSIVSPLVRVRASRYCDSANPLTQDLTQSWTFSGIDNCTPLCCSSFSASASGTNLACAGSTHGDATVNVTNGNPSFLYIWSTAPPQITPTAHNLGAGTYTCTVTDAQSCTSTASVTLTEPTAISANITGINVACYGASTGEATVNSSGGTGAHTYIWSNNQTVSHITGLSAGVYTVTVKDANLCTATASVTITQPSAITISFNSTNVSCNGGNNGTATANPSGGTGTYTYLWSSNSQTGSTANNLAAGVYTVTVTDANSCTKTASVTITQPTAVSISMSSTPTCMGFSTGTATANPSGGTSPYTYSWSTVPAQTTSTASSLSAGTYTCTVTDNHSCQQQGTASVSTNPQIVLSSPTDPAAIIPVSAAGASDGGINLSVSGGTSPYTYLWSNFATTQDLSNLPVGTYAVTVTDVYLCTATQSYFVPEPPDECDAGFATYTQGGYGNCGFPGQFMQSHFGSEFTSGLMIGCTTGTGYKQLIADCYQAVRNFLPSGTKNNGPQALNATYSDPIKPGCNFNGNCACATNIPGCVSSNPTVYSNVFAGQVMTLTLNLGFDGATGFSTNTYPFSDLYYVGTGPFYGLTVGEILAEANAKLGGCTTTVGFTYTISELNNTVDLINKSWDNAQCPNGSCGILSCTASQNNFSLSSTSSDLQVACMPENASCVNGYSASIITSVHGGTPPYSYLWSNGETDPDLENLAPGIYAVTVTDDDANSVLRFAYVYSDASFDEPVYFSTGFSNLTVTFTDNSTESSSGATETWSWNFGDPSSGTNTSTLQNPSHTFTAEGTYNVCLTVTYTSGLSSCQKSYCGDVCIKPVSVSIAATATTICSGTSVTFTATPSNGGSSPSYQWKRNGSNVGTNSPTYISSSLANSDVITCVLTSNATPCATGNPATSNSITMTVNPLPDASTGSNQTVCAAVSISLGAAPVSGHTYSWSPSTYLSSATVSNPTFNSSTAGTTNYTLAETITATGCQKSNGVSVTVNSSQPVSVSISASPGTTICSLTSVTFTATPANEGSSPSYQWKLNGSNVGTNSTYTSSSLANSDVVTCVLTSNITPCPTGSPATSNSITMTVNPLPDANTGDNQNVCSGETISIGAASISGHTYSWSPTTNLSSGTAANPTFTSSTAGTTAYTLTETITATGCTKSKNDSVTVISGGGNPSFTCNSSNLVVATPYTTCVSPGSNDYLMMQVKIHLGGGCSGAQRKLQTLKFNASSATCNNIENAKLWYSGNTSSFANAQIVSGSGTITSVSCSANNTWNAGTLQVMQPGDNYFWVTYKIRSTATTGQSVQATLVSVTVVANGNTTCSTFGGSTASRTIQSSGCGTVRFDNPEASADPRISMTVFPNPLTDQTTFRFVSEKDAKIMLELFDISGQKIKILFNGNVEAGKVNEVELYTSGMGAGIYYYRLTSEEETDFGKLIIVK